MVVNGEDLSEDMEGSGRGPEDGNSAWGDGGRGHASTVAPVTAPEVRGASPDGSSSVATVTLGDADAERSGSDPSIGTADASTPSPGSPDDGSGRSSREGCPSGAADALEDAGAALHCAPDLGSVPPEEGPVDGDEARKQHHALLFKRTTSVPHNISRYRDVLGMHATGFGGKHISDMGSFVLNLNNIMGPALVLLPLLNQQAGWLAPQVLGTAFCVLSAVVSGMLVEAMQRIPGNRGFNERYEFVTLMRHYFGRRGFYLAQVAYNLTMMATNLAQMTITAQVLDQLLRHVLGASYAVIYGVWPPAVASYPVDQPQWSDHAIGSANHVSLGLALAMALCLPLGYMNLEDNMWFQYLSAGTFCMLVAAFVAEFATRMVTDPSVRGLWPEPLTPAVTDLLSQATVLGVTLFFHSYIVTVPSWVNEKARGTSVARGIWIPTAATAAIKVVFGLAGAWAFRLLTFPHGVGGYPRGEPLPGASNILSHMLDCVQTMATRYAVYAFTVLTLVPGIPIISILTRYNLLSGDLCSPATAYAVGVVLPWILTAFTYNRGALLTTCNWVALLVQGYTNFVLPVAMYREAVRRHKYPGEPGADRASSSRSLRARASPVVATIPEDEEWVGDLHQCLLTEEDLIEVDSADFSDEPLFYALPEALSRRVWPETFASWLMWTMAALCTFAIAFNVACHIVGIAADE